VEAVCFFLERSFMVGGRGRERGRRAREKKVACISGEEVSGRERATKKTEGK